MGRSHIAGALIAGVGFAATIPHAPLLVRGLVVAVTGGSGLLLDLDHPSGKAARSLGFVTRLLAQVIAAFAVAVYHGTRTDADAPGDGGGHRKITHTVPGVLGFGVIAGVAVWAHPIAGAVAGGLMCGLMALGFRSLGAGFTLGGAGVTWWTLTHDPQWLWTVPVAVTLGALAHLGCDAFTNSGVPLLWPFVVHGQRWYRVKTPATFSTGGPVETTLVAPLLWVGLGVTTGLATGVLPVLVAAVSAVIRG